MKTILPRFLSAAVCTLMAISASADTKLVTDGAPLRYLVPQDGSLGGTWRSPGFNDSSWTAGENGIGYEVNPGAYNASVIADSRGEFSTSGRQGENSWLNGYYNLSLDPDATYQATDFQPFPRSDGPWGPDNFWAGGGWEWFNGDPPWDSIYAADVHPNGINNAEEHWVIRRWHSTESGPITLRFHVRKSNLNGTGVTGKIFKNGTEIFSRAISGNDGTGFDVYVNTTANVGDVFDFAHTPLGSGGDPGDGADGSIMTATILSGTIVPPPPPVVPGVVADTSADWSGTGTQGANGWYYGFYNRTADADSTYNPATDFNTTDPNWTYGGGQWTLGPADPPWDTIGQSEWHPNGDNNVEVHWVIRRWVSDEDGDFHAKIRFGKSNRNGGNGTTLRVLHNGTEVLSRTIPFNEVGVDLVASLPGVFIGDTIEFALDPLGTDGSLNDGADGSFINAQILRGPPAQTTVADSVADWSSTGVQGANGWYYGFYNFTADADATYNPGAEFNTTDPNWTFGGAWTLGPGDPPWDIIGQTDWHPNGDNNVEVHWVIKRWVSDVDGDLHARVEFGKQNPNGSGTTLRVFHNGTQLFSQTIAGNNTGGITNAIALPGVFIGDTIEFALDSLGTDGSRHDGADGSYIRAKILTGPPPEPPQPFVPGIGDCFMTDVEAAMKGVNPSIFIRIPFDVANPAAIETLKLKMKYNDGYAAYLNGTEIAKRNAPTAIAGITVADSVADWSTTGTQGENGWSYGYYNQSLDADGTYSGGSDMTAFPRDGAGYSPTDFWDGNGYNWFNGDPPWTELYREATHPAHPNGAAFDPNVPTTHIHWTVRRWNATVDANLKARIRFRKTNVNCGDGVRLSVFHNSVQVYSQTITGTDGVGRDDTIDIPDVFLGDNIDIMLGPGDGNDFCDGTAYSMVLFEGEPTIPWNGTATATRTTTQSITPEVIDISTFISLLNPGANVLAIQGINGAVSDNEFLINAELLANRVPTANPDTAVAGAGAPTTYLASELLANDSDPDGDQLLLVGVTPSYVTAQGGSVRLYGDTVRYTPPSGFTGTDSFQYTTTDLSGVPVRATVTVNVVQPLTVSITRPADGATVDACTTATICADANVVAGVGGSVTQVSFFANGTVPLGVAATSPYCVEVPGPAVQAGVYTLTAVATHSSGATVTSAPITVNAVDGPPVLNCPASVTAECGAPVVFTATALDACDGPRPVTCVPPSGSTLEVGSHSVICTAADQGGRSASCTFTVTVTDSTPPIVTVSFEAGVSACNSNIVVETTDPNGVILPYVVNALDPCGVSSGPSCSAGSTFPVGTTTVTCTAVNAAGLTGSCSFTVTVVLPNQPPVCVAQLGPDKCGVTFPFQDKLYAIAVKKDYACLVLSGSGSSDPDGDALTISWVIDGTNLVTGTVVTNCMDLGCHTVTMVADDGRERCHQFLDVCIITPSEAVEQLIGLVESTPVDRKNKRPLITSLKAAKKAFDRDGWKRGAQMLEVFKHKVKAQIARHNPAEAAMFTDAADNIIEAIKCVIKQPRKGDDDGDDDDDRNNDDDDGPNNGGGHHGGDDDDD